LQIFRVCRTFEGKTEGKSAFQTYKNAPTKTVHCSIVEILFPTCLVSSPRRFV